MTTKNTTGTQSSVRFSRVMSRRWVVALGASISVGLGVFTLLGQFGQVAGKPNVGLSYLVMALLVLPLVLTYAERAAVIPGSGGPFNLARTSRMVWLTYASGWLLLGGYVSLLTLLGWGVGLHLNILAEHLFQTPLDLPLLATAVIGIVALNSLAGIRGTWKGRSPYIYIGLIILSVVIFRTIFGGDPTGQISALVRNNNRVLQVAALMISSLWGLYLILDIRDQVSRPTQTLMPAMLLTVALAGGLGILASWALLGYSGPQSSLTPLVDMAPETGLISQELLLVLYALSGLLLTLIGLNQGLAHGLRLVGAMTQEKFLPERFQTVSTKFDAPVLSLFIFVLLSILLVNVVSILAVVGLASLTFLWVAALVHLPDALRAKPNLPEQRSPRLPFHPLFPWLTVATGFLLPVNLSVEAWGLGGAWLLLGGLLYLSYARQASLSARRREEVVGEITAGEFAAPSAYQVMVGIANPKTAPALLQAGAKLARARQGSLLALRVLSLPEQMPVHLKRRTAQEEWQALENLVQQEDLGEVTVKPLVRLAPNPAAGLLSTVTEEAVDLLVVGWTTDYGADEPDPASIFDSLIRRAPCDLAVLRRPLPAAVKRVLVPTAGGPHAPVALALGLDLAESGEGKILVEHLVAADVGREREATAEGDLQSTLNTVKADERIESRIVSVETLKEGILNEAEAADLLLIGASRVGFVEHSFFGGLSVEVAEVSTKPTILVRGREPSDRFGMARLFAMLSDYLPTVTAAERTVVLQDMRQSAQPSVDFFVLITLAAVIASMGLLQNSAAVIIGAMLVAPLMSPILAMAMSLVQGNVRHLWVAAEATAKGIALAILVGVVMTIISPIDAPTNEIMARTSPNLLDLVVALASGAAAGYAVGRKEVSAALPGVAISVALVPPLCVVGYGLATSELGIAVGAMILFTTNLAAIVLAGSIVFLALGFLPERAQRGEVLRGLRVAAMALVPIVLILTLVTTVSVVQSTRTSIVESIFRQETVSRAVEPLDLDVFRRGAGFVIDGVFLNIEEQRLSPTDWGAIQDEIQEGVGGGPILFSFTTIPGSRGESEDIARLRELEVLFTGKIVARTAQVEDITIDESNGSFIITTTVTDFPEEQLTRAEMVRIQEELSEAMNAPVTIRATVHIGTRLNIEAPPLPTPEP